MIPRTFFQRDPLTCSRELIGAEFIWGECAGIIVETEAYSVCNDEACHAFLRPTTRAYMAAHQAGDAYVYMNYGVHWLVNVLIKGGAEDGFVLLRALEPTRGMERMAERRARTDPRALCSGPGKLTQALGITGADHGRNLCAGAAVGFRPRAEPVEIVTDLRVGISRAAELPWRFLARGSPFVSIPHGRVKPPAAKRKRGAVAPA